MLPLLLRRSHHLKSSYHRLTLSLSASPILNSFNDLKQIHASLLVSSGFGPSSVSSKLISLYAEEFSDLRSVVSVFDSLREPDTMAWNTIIKTLVDFGYSDEALILYRKMMRLGVVHDGYTFPIVNRAVLLLDGDVVYGEMVHCVAMKMGFGLDLYFCNTMIDIYGRRGYICLAHKVFDGMSERDLVSWTSIISVYVSGLNVGVAFGLFNKMRMVMEPNSIASIVLLQGCSVSERLIEGKQIHAYITKSGLLIDGTVQNSILRMYSKAGSAEEVENFFDEIDPRDIVSWNTLLSFYSSSADTGEVVDRFRKIQYEVAVSLETLSLVISAFAKRGDYSEGQKLHSFATKSGLCDDVLQTSLLDFYAKCGDLESCTRLFNNIPNRNSIHWSAMMSGFVQNGYFHEAIASFQQLQDSGIKPVLDILRNLVDAYSNLGALRLGKSVHAYLTRNSFNSEKDDIRMETSILNMYIRCGNISTATECFNRFPTKDVVTWTSMIEGYAAHGFGTEALKLFHQMVEEGNTKPNSVTFLSLLSACSHSALVTQGCEIFSSMRWHYGIEPELDHYTCLVDLLARSGNPREALTIAIKMVVCHDTRIWRALLSASRAHEERKIGEFCAQRMLELEPDNVGCYVLLSNVKASGERWNEVEEVRREMNEKDLRKKPGWSYLEANTLI